MNGIDSSVLKRVLGDGAVSDPVQSSEMADQIARYEAMRKAIAMASKGRPDERAVGAQDQAAMQQMMRDRFGLDPDEDPMKFRHIMQLLNSSGSTGLPEK